MKQTKQTPVRRSFSDVKFLDIYIVSAFTAIIIIRIFLELTGYPQIGGHGMHIAHVLWGGLLMMIGYLLLLITESRHRLLATILSGIGFGLFVDEIGKFVTSNTNYFYQPAAMLIYLSLMLTWLVTRWLLTAHNNKPFLPSVNWPRRKSQKYFAVSVLCLIVLNELRKLFDLYISLTEGTVHGLILHTGYIIAAIYSLCMLYAIATLAWKKQNKALGEIRFLTIANLVFWFPISIYQQQFAAYASLLMYILFIVCISNPEAE